MSHILYYHRFQCRVHNRPLLAPILSHINPMHSPPSYSYNSRFKWCFHLRLGLQSGFFPSGLQPVCISLFSHTHQMPHPTHPSWFDSPNDSCDARNTLIRHGRFLNVAFHRRYWQSVYYCSHCTVYWVWEKSGSLFTRKFFLFLSLFNYAFQTSFFALRRNCGPV